MERLICGVDEVGRGCLSGPVMAAAVILPDGFTDPIIRDSKKLSAAQRERAYNLILEKALYVSSGFVDEKTIDEINILNATFMAMEKAIIGLHIKPDFLYIDGDKFPGYQDVPHECIVKGDSLVPCISAASIVAKVRRDELMKDLAQFLPGYGWETNVGYGTNEHIEAIKKLGLTAHHRKTFCKNFTNG
jgi:ribonuclease HII